MFRLAIKIPAWLRLAGRSAAWKSAEILLLRHQLAVLQRQMTARPRLTWADRAVVAALMALIPLWRHCHLRLLATPATILRWHRDLARRRWAETRYRALAESISRSIRRTRTARFGMGTDTAREVTAMNESDAGRRYLGDRELRPDEVEDLIKIGVIERDPNGGLRFTDWGREAKTDEVIERAEDLGLLDDDATG